MDVMKNSISEDFSPPVDPLFIQVPGSAVKSSTDSQIKEEDDGIHKSISVESLNVTVVNVQIQSLDDTDKANPHSDRSLQPEIAVNETASENGDEEEEEEGIQENTEISKDQHNSEVPESVDYSTTQKNAKERSTSLLDVNYNADGSVVTEKPDDSKELEKFEKSVEEMKNAGENPVKSFFLNLHGISEEDVEDKMEGSRMDLSDPTSARTFCESISKCMKDQSHQARIAVFYSVDLLIVALQQHRDNPELVLKLCTTIRDLTAMNSILQIRFGKEGCGRLFSSLLEQHQSRFEIMIILCEVIRNIVVKDQGKVQFGKEGCCEVLVNTLSGYVQNPEAATLICGALLNISANSMENKRILGELGCCEPLVEVLLIHLTNPLVIKIVCGAIQNISVYDENKKKFGEHGCCEALVHILLLYMENPMVTWEIFGAIRNVSLYESNMNLFESIGALELLTKALIMHMNSADITRQVCGALRRMLLFPNRIRTPPNVELIKQVWAKKFPLYERYRRMYNEEIICESLVDTLAKHAMSHQAEVIKEICAAIKALALNNDYWQKFDLATCGPLLLTVLKHYTNPIHIHQYFRTVLIGDVIKEISGAINALARNEDIRIQFYNFGACEVFAEIYQLQLSPVPLPPLPLSSLPIASADSGLSLSPSAVTSSSPAVNVSIDAASSSSPPLSNAEQEQAEAEIQVTTPEIPLSAHLEILKEMSRLIKNFALNEESKRLLGKLGLCDALVKTLDLGLAHGEVVSLVCGAILNLSANNPENKVLFGRAGVCERLIQVVVIYLSNEEVLKQACGAIKNISVYDENKYQFGEYGGCSALIAAITTHLTNRELLMDICEALWNIAVIEENQVMIGEIGGCEILLEALATYFYPMIQKSSSDASLASTGGESTPLSAEESSIAAVSSTAPLMINTSTAATAATTATVSKKVATRNIIRLFCGLLKTLSQTKKNHIKIGSPKGCDLLMKLLSKQQKSPEVIKILLQLLAVLLTNETVKKSFGEAGGGEKLVTLFLMKRNLDTDIIQILLKALQSLAMNQAMNRQKLFRAGCCEVLTESLRRLPKLIEMEILRKYSMTSTVNTITVGAEKEEKTPTILKGAEQIKKQEESKSMFSIVSEEEKVQESGGEDRERERDIHSLAETEGEKNPSLPGFLSAEKILSQDGMGNVQSQRKESTASIQSTPSLSAEMSPSTVAGFEANGPKKLIEMKHQDMKKKFKVLMDRLSKDSQFKKRFEELGTYRYVQEIPVPEKKVAVTRVDFDTNLKPLASVVDQMQRRQKFSDQRFNNTTILL